MRKGTSSEGVIATPQLFHFPGPGTGRLGLPEFRRRTGAPRDRVIPAVGWTWLGDVDRLLDTTGWTPNADANSLNVSDTLRPWFRSTLCDELEDTHIKLCIGREAKPMEFLVGAEIPRMAAGEVSSCGLFTVVMMEAL